ncbi:MAG: epoxyqueuosine reductase [Deltaproteobacteria bacterium]|nr:epoxyqueuosine reductase [Deltaproteobacteria bacterium]
MGQELSINDLKGFAERYVEAEKQARTSGVWWRAPLLVSATIDHRFDDLRSIAAQDHLLPKELLPSARSVIVFFVPFTKELVKENRKGDRPSRNWGIAYVETNDLISRLSQALSDLLAGHGYRSALTPATHNFDEVKLMARWSHKHLGHIAGLGRFGTNCLLITQAGCAGRLGSLVTEATLGDHPLIEKDQTCLLKAGKPCGKCIQACPVSALEESQFMRRACWDRLVENRKVLGFFRDLPDSTHVCGKCASFLPCSFKDPTAQSEKRETKEPGSG